MARSEPAMRPATKISLLTISVAGAIYCLLNAAGAQILCLTEGCRIYAGYGLFGIPFYLYGAAGFLAIFLLTLLHRWRPADWLLCLVLFAGLLLDALFLAWQSLFWPCLSCLIVALMFGLAALVALWHFRGGRRHLLSAAGGLWLIFFLFVSLATVRELAFRPWPAFGPAEAPVKVFFSPDCPACRQTIGEILDDPEATARAAFYPVAKNAEDRRRIASFLNDTRGREANRLEFLGLFESPSHTVPPLGWRDHWRLLANKAALARTGLSTVPLVISPGLLKTSPRRFDFNPFAETPLFPGPEGPDGCSAFAEEACDD